MAYLPDPKLPDWYAPPETLQGGGRNSATRTNDLSENIREQNINIAALGKTIPLAYGHVRITGDIVAWAKSGTDLVLAVAWCLGEIEAYNAIYINGEVLDPSVSVTNYRGTVTQGVDPTLSSLITAYNDSLVVSLPSGQIGIAYSVVTIPEAAVSEGWPRVEADINARKIVDVRDSSIAAHDNPALIANDIITNSVFSAGMTATGVADCADWCDSLIGGAMPRCRSSLVIRGSKLEDLIAMMSDYGEFFYSIDGASVFMVPDAPVDTSNLPVFDDSVLRANSLDIQEASRQDTPTVCEVTITQPSGGAESWGKTIVSAKRSGVETGDLARIPTSLSLPGIYRSEEGKIKASSRLQKVKFRRNITFSVMDRGIKLQRGDVITIQSDALLSGYSITVRVMSINQVEPGRWTVSAINYSEDHYPTTYDVSGADVPVGLILPLAGVNPAPDGWDVFTDANGAYLYGAGGVMAPGTSAPATSATVSVTGTTTNDGYHYSGSEVRTGKEPGGYNDFGLRPASDGSHSHDFTTPQMTPHVHNYTPRLAIKVGSVASAVAPELYAFGLPNIEGLERSFEYVGRVIGAAATESVSDVANAQIAIFDLDSTSDGAHSHISYSRHVKDSVPDFYPAPDEYHVNGSGGWHTHSTEAYLLANPARKRLAMYSASGFYGVKPGFIGGWSGSIASIPTDWSLCDGTNGTPDLTDGFIEVADDGNESTGTGNDTVSAVLVDMADVGHAHTLINDTPPDQLGSTHTTRSFTTGHTSIVYHKHRDLNGSVSWTPAKYALAFIMYTPGA